MVDKKKQQPLARASEFNLKKSFRDNSLLYIYFKFALVNTLDIFITEKLSKI